MKKTLKDYENLTFQDEKWYLIEKREKKGSGERSCVTIFLFFFLKI